MITIEFETLEYYDDGNNKFIYDEHDPVRFEYSLKVVYDWEAKWKKPFLRGNLTDREMFDFYLMMALDELDDRFLNDDVMEKLSNYITDPNTATTFSTFDEVKNGNKSFNKGKIYTAEELYALMTMEGVPLEFENRNLNRLMTILRIIGNYKSPPKKMDRADIVKQNAQLNAERKKLLQSKG